MSYRPCRQSNCWGSHVLLYRALFVKRSVSARLRGLQFDYNDGNFQGSTARRRCSTAVTEWWWCCAAFKPRPLKLETLLQAAAVRAATAGSAGAFRDRPNRDNPRSINSRARDNTTSTSTFSVDMTVQLDNRVPGHIWISYHDESSNIDAGLMTNLMRPTRTPIIPLHNRSRTVSPITRLTNTKIPLEEERNLEYHAANYL
jgi:hypothetical protein